MKNINSIVRNKDFKRIYAKGKYVSSNLIVTYVFKNKFNLIRVGITTSKKIGNAVQRNRSRRVIRAAFKSLDRKLTCGYDIVFVARKDTPFVKSYNILKDMTYQLKRLGILR